MTRKMQAIVGTSREPSGSPNDLSGMLPSWMPKNAATASPDAANEKSAVRERAIALSWLSVFLTRRSMTLAYFGFRDI
jgi:hypothetical protein